MTSETGFIFFRDRRFWDERVCYENVPSLTVLTLFLPPTLPILAIQFFFIFSLVIKKSQHPAHYILERGVMYCVDVCTFYILYYMYPR